MKSLKHLKTALTVAALTFSTTLLAFWPPGKGNTDYCPNGAWGGDCPWEWVPPGLEGIDWSSVALWLTFF